MDLREFKIKLLETGLFKKVYSRPGQYRCQICPYCGDNKWHLYVKIDLDDDEPVLRNCFHCGGGLLDQRFLDYFGIELKVPYIKGRRKIQPNDVTSELIELFDETRDLDMLKMSIEYIQQRVGVTPTIDDLKAFQIIGQPLQYINTYLGGECRSLRNRIWFRLSNGNIIGRTIDDSINLRWVKHNYSGKPNGNGIYVIKRQISTDQPIHVCICEGVMDAIGLYYHNEIPNSVYIAVLGKNYGAGMMHPLDMGIFGDSVFIHIMKDADVNFPKIPKKYVPLFKSVDVYMNTASKDYGVPKNKIMIQKVLSRKEE